MGLRSAGYGLTESSWSARAIRTTIRPNYRSAAWPLIPLVPPGLNDGLIQREASSTRFPAIVGAQSRFRLRVKSSDGTLLLGASIGINRTVTPSEGDRFVENILEELDAVDEWYFDQNSHWLYFKPSQGVSPARAGFVAARLETLIELRGSAAARIHDLTVSGLVFRETETTFLKTTEPLLRSDWMFYRGGAIVSENAQRIVISNNLFDELGGNAIVASGYNRNVAIQGNEIHDIGASAIAFVGRPEAVRSPLFEYQQTQPTARIDRAPGPESDAYPADSIAEDNLIYAIGSIEKQSAGVEISMAARITVRHNSIYHVPRAGINIGDGTWGGHVIVDNDVFDTVLETGITAPSIAGAETVIGAPIVRK